MLIGCSYLHNLSKTAGPIFVLLALSCPVENKALADGRCTLACVSLAQVLATYGHVRDLVNTAGSVEPEAGFAMHWRRGTRSAEHLRAILAAVSKGCVFMLAGVAMHCSRVTHYNYVYGAFWLAILAAVSRKRPIMVAA